jgi:hypothetical protein
MRARLLLITSCVAAALLVGAVPVNAAQPFKRTSGGVSWSDLVPRATADRVTSAVARRPATSSRPRVAPTVGALVAGLGSTGSAPSDDQIGVGPTSVVQMVNNSVAIWPRSGAGVGPAPVLTMSLGRFFSSVSITRTDDEVTDPRVLYDARTGRWFFAVFDTVRNQTIVEVSRTSDPAGSRLLYTVQSSNCPDQPRLGVSDHLVALGLDIFQNCDGGPFIGGQLILFDKDKLLAGVTSYNKFGPQGGEYQAITPAQSLGPTPTQFFASTSTTRTDTLYVYAATTIERAGVTTVRVRTLDNPPKAPQGGSTVLIDTDGRAQDAFWENGVLWVAAAARCRVSARGCGRFLAISTSNFVVLRDAEESLDAGRHLFYPAIRPDAAGNLVAVFGYSSPTEFPSVGAVVNPGPGSVWTTLARGTGPTLVDRWGDYFGAARDPVDPSRVWVTGQIGRGGPESDWGTVFASLSAPGVAPPSLVDTAPPRVQALPGAARRGSKARLSYRVFEDSGETREVIRILRGTKAIASVSSTLGFVDDGATYSLPWRVPRTLRPGSLRFCVTAFDRTGNRSAPSCAALKIR